MFKGSITALVTPMTAAGQVDSDSMRALVDEQCLAGTHGLVVNGTTGEACTLTEHEQTQTLALVLEAANDKIPIIAGTGSNSTAKTIVNTQSAHRHGAQACLVVTPYYNRPTQAGLLQHFQQVADAAHCPIFLYNVPARTACDLLPDTVAKLSAHPNILGIKEATGDIARLKQLQAICEPGFIYFSGDDSTCLEFMLSGGHGVISVAANVVPDKIAQLCEFIFNKEYQVAQALNDQLQLLYQGLSLEPNPIPVKYVLEYLNKIVGGVRLPLTKLESSNQIILRQTLLKMGLLEKEVEHVS